MKFFIRRYINRMHREWLKDMVKTTRIQVEKAYKAGISQVPSIEIKLEFRKTAT